MKPPETVYTGKRITGPNGEVYGVKVTAGGRPLSPDRSLRIREHSPTGFEWGYRGSGPAQLALAILLDVTGSPSAARQYYQRYKEAAVGNWGPEWETTAGEVVTWIMQFELNELAAERLRTARHCRVCGCTDDDCRECIAVLGEPCHWVDGEPDLCSRCWLEAHEANARAEGGAA